MKTINRACWIITLGGLLLAGQGIAQIPTIDVSSLQQLVQQYHTMQQQLSTSRDIVTRSTQILGVSEDILNMEQTIFRESLGNVNVIKNRMESWIRTFQNRLENLWGSDQFQLPNIATLPDLNRNLNYWIQQVGGVSAVTNLNSSWQTAVSNWNKDVATSWERQATVAGYNARLVDTAKESREQGKTILRNQTEILENVQEGTIIEQTAAQNALLHQQTQMLDKMKNDISDATLAEAAERDLRLRREAEKRRLRQALNHALIP